MRSPVADLLGDLGTALAESRVEWFLFGAQAAIVYGVARLTAYVDVTARVPVGLENRDLVAALETRGFRVRFTDLTAIAQHRVLPFVHVTTGLPVDIVLAGPGLEDEFFARAALREVDGVRVPIVDLGDLVVMKVLAGRPKDIEDVVTLLRIHAETIDLTRVTDTLLLLESALGQSDLRPVLDRALREAGRQ